MADDDPNVETSDEFSQRMRRDSDTSGSGSTTTTDEQKPVEPLEVSPPQQPGQPAPKAQPATEADKARQEYDDAIQEGIRLHQQFRVDQDQATKARQWAHQEMQKLLSTPQQQLPSYEDLYGQADQVQPPDMQQWNRKKLMTMMAYAAVALPLAMLFGRKGPAAWGAMRGFGEGLEAINQGADERARQSFTIWKAEKDEAIRRGERYLNYTKDVIANRKTDLQEKMTNLGLVADMYGDQELKDKALDGDWEKVIKLYQARVNLLTNAKKTGQNVEKAIFNQIGLDQLHKDYVNWLAQKYPDLRKGLYSNDSDQYWKAYDDGSGRLGSHWEDFVQQKAKENKELHPGKTEQKNPEKTSDDPLGLGLPQGSTDEQGGGGGEW